MAHGGLLWFFTVVCLSALQIQADLATVDCTKENKGVFGQQSMLECVVNIEGEYPEIEMVVWMKDGVDSPLLKYENNDIENSPRHSFADPSWNKNNMNVSLLITDTEMADQEDYTCMVITSRGSDQHSTSLKLQAKYKVPTIVEKKDEKTLTCHTDSGYPSGELRWFSGHDDWTKSAKMEVNRMYNGLYSLTSHLPLLPGSTLPKYTCVVYNASGSREDSDTFKVEFTAGEMGASSEHSPGNSPSKIVAPVLTIGSLIVGLLLVLVLRKRCFQHNHHMDYTREGDIEEGELQNMRTDAATLTQS